MPKENERVYKGKDIQMLMAIEIILRLCIEHQSELITERTNLTIPYFENLREEVKKAFHIMGGSKARQSFETTNQILSAWHDAYDRLSILKTNLESFFEEEPQYLKELLLSLGFTQHFDAARKGKQENTIQLLYAFKEGLTDELSQKLISRGEPPAKLTELIAYAEILKSLNVTHKGAKSENIVLTAKNIIAFNKIYKKVIDVAKLAQKVFKDRPTIQKQFVYTGILHRMHPRPTKITDHKKPTLTVVE